jgi:hypothetical protein
VADVEHALGDEVRFEKCEAWGRAHMEPNLMQQPAEDPKPEPEPDPPKAKQERPVPELCPWDKVIDRLRGLDRKIVTSGNPDQIMAQCPAHDDNHPSLAVGRKPDGTVGLHCFGPCKTEDVLAVLGLEWRDLWDGVGTRLVG